MLIEILIFLFLGILAGTFTGLAPGIHINLVGAILVSLSASSLAFIAPLYLIIFITAMAITHTFIDFIPSIFLGCSDGGNELSILPGHEMLKEGKGYGAVILTATGGLTAIILTIIFSWPLVEFVKNIYPLIKTAIPFILIFVSLVIILSERRKLSSFIVYSLAGILGVIILNLNSLKDPLLPLLTGLFGSASLIVSIKNKTKIPRQNFQTEKVPITKPIAGALISSPLCGFLPGLGSGQAAVIGNLVAKTDRRGFLVLLGATNIFVMSFSFISLYAISKTRTGAAAAIKELMGNLSAINLILMLGVILISGIVSFLLVKILAKYFAKNINKINYSKLSIFVLIFLLMLVFFISGWLGVLSFTVSTLTGIYCINTGVKRTNMMACLLLPTILLYLRVL
ncbi:tripartite tricarboxylate transporter permease [Candidatus Pacearchaeota archaeon]|nr:tripartite tricarboxylate transporter permease [Candidatus Pacearchaeota archaeon]